jgi:hypothetical protein
MPRGALSIIDSHVSMDNVNFFQSISFFRGGGIYIRSSQVTMERCTVSGNAAFEYFGGGIQLIGNLTMPSCKLIKFVPFKTQAASI